ncbi:MAG: hypothetical protein KC468_19795 [Myxococcales bacterium]|nr:hypothetical protein [Myxococcales bacterium]
MNMSTHDIAEIAARAFPPGRRRPRDLLPLWHATRAAAQRLERVLAASPETPKTALLLRDVQRLLRQLEGYRLALLDAHPDDEEAIRYSVIEGLLVPASGDAVEVGAIPWPAIGTLASIISSAAQVIGLTQSQVMGLTRELSAKLRDAFTSQLAKVLPRIPSTEEIWARIRPYAIVSTLGTLTWVLYKIARGPQIVVKCSK